MATRTTRFHGSSGSNREMDAKGAVEAQIERISVIDAMEALGYRGEGHEEHTGETKFFYEADFDLANNRPEDM